MRHAPTSAAGPVSTPDLDLDLDPGSDTRPATRSEPQAEPQAEPGSDAGPAALAPAPEVTGFYEARTGSVQYVVADPATGQCAVIDPVLDYDEKSGATATIEADRILAFIAEKGYALEWILDTHPHADHFSAADYLRRRTGAPTAIGEKVVEVQKLWKEFYNWPDFPADGSQWDKLFAEGETFRLGSIPARVLFSPGHTLASISYVIGDAAFVHDTLFMPDSGTARADFPGGDAHALWRSIQAILALPDATRVFTGHDYCQGGRAPAWESTVAEQKARNSHMARYRTEAAFVAARQARDRTLPMPKLILHALQVNTNAGRLPAPEANGRRYLKIPLDLLQAPWD
ncbi:glyoxylase-like metal-dependent hydrolase (beta-lactamase superfamily II) [Paracoccus pantotrophus]|uniref:Glyoxylase-like metal-dependent hydrolase (Beta-lactamase superfamily II) n=2 Tax=Paracoccus pantotrophus TaxID=82367 RepID=A0ABX9S6A5_PARPN|nr:glyoxylase-like metal-dependent hydrolase (beta-lactamase superfamily II) [Paracoccus pantotrophus]RKS43537.1 glyoxylase-like metal-dependent hydrolase (beta-lactamase superfamily II) [Paracoccus pantotrophus]